MQVGFVREPPTLPVGPSWRRRCGHFSALYAQYATGLYQNLAFGTTQGELIASSCPVITQALRDDETATVRRLLIPIVS